MQDSLLADTPDEVTQAYDGTVPLVTARPKNYAYDLLWNSSIS